jgi:hypothetical protein
MITASMRRLNIITGVFAARLVAFHLIRLKYLRQTISYILLARSSIYYTYLRLNDYIYVAISHIFLVSFKHCLFLFLPELYCRFFVVSLNSWWKPAIALRCCAVRSLWRLSFIRFLCRLSHCPAPASSSNQRKRIRLATL